MLYYIRLIYCEFKEVAVGGLGGEEAVEGYEIKDKHGIHHDSCMGEDKDVLFAGFFHVFQKGSDTQMLVVKGFAAGRRDVQPVVEPFL